MAMMERADDFVFTVPLMSLASAAVTFRTVLPRACKLVKSFVVLDDTISAQPVLTFASADGNLTDTHTLPTAGGSAAGDISSQDHREEANNQFAEGTELTCTLATVSAGDTATLSLVMRVL